MSVIVTCPECGAAVKPTQAETEEHRTVLRRERDEAVALLRDANDSLKVAYPIRNKTGQREQHPCILANDAFLASINAPTPPTPNSDFYACASCGNVSRPHSCPSTRLDSRGGGK